MMKIVTMYPAYIALIIVFNIVILLQAWFVRRLSRLRDQAHDAKTEYHKLHSEVVELSEMVNELSRGKESNEVSQQTLKREIEDIEGMIQNFLEEHEELREQYEVKKEGSGAGPSKTDEAPQEGDAPQDADRQEVPEATAVPDDA